jgi:hypothetical protein
MMRIRSRSTLRPRTCSNIRLGIEDIREVWASDPIFYPAKPPAHWLMVAELTVRSSWCRSHLHATAIHDGADPSAATAPRNTSQIYTGETDDPTHDPR